MSSAASVPVGNGAAVWYQSRFFKHLQILIQPKSHAKIEQFPEYEKYKNIFGILHDKLNFRIISNKRKFGNFRIIQPTVSYRYQFRKKALHE